MKPDLKAHCLGSARNMPFFDQFYNNLWLFEHYSGIILRMRFVTGVKGYLIHTRLEGKNNLMLTQNLGGLISGLLSRLIDGFFDGF